MLSDVIEIVRRTVGAPLVVPAGAAAPFALFGPIGLALELNEQLHQLDINPDLVVLPVGTGGTALGLAIGRGLARAQWKIVGVRIDDYPLEHYRLLAATATRYRPVSDLMSEQSDDGFPYEFHEGAVGAGYGAYSPADVVFSERIFEETGVYFGPTYMLKCLQGLDQLARSGSIAAGSKVVVVHTGGTGERATAKHAANVLNKSRVPR